MTTFEKNPNDVYPAEVQKWINLIRIGDDVSIVGSIAYRILKQYADIDLLERLDVDSSFNEWVYYDAMKSCINRMITHGAKYGDIKCGTHEKYKRLKKYLGNLVNSDVKNYDGTGMDIELKTMRISEIVRNGVFELKRKYEMSHALIDWEELAEYIRNLYTIHWTQHEFISGFKHGVSGEPLQLIDYIIKEPIKMDMFVNISGNWVEISNIQNIDRNGVPFNYVPLTKNQIYDSIADNAEKFLYSPLFKSTYKGLKRLWILARMREDVQMGNIFASLINSDVNNLYIAKSYLETMAVMKLNGYIVDFKEAKQNIKWLVSHSTTININMDVFNNELTTANTFEELAHLKKVLTSEVNSYAVKWVNKKGIQPIINKYLQKCISYKHSDI